MYMATLKQIAANRRNALKSTGPVSEEGKNQSRRNALKHGLAGSGVVLPLSERAAVEDRIAEWHSSLKPFDNYENWLLEVVAIESIRVDRCRVQDRALRQEQIHRACDSWDQDQRQAADELATRLGKNPSVVAKLRKTVSGASILVAHWRGLSQVLDHGDWSEMQEGLALDLLGTPEALREGVASPLCPGPDGDAFAHRREIVRAQIEWLDRLIFETLPARDEDKRALIQAGMPDLEDRALVRLHRYEARCFRRLTWATQQMRLKHRNIAISSDPPRQPIFARPPLEQKSPTISLKKPEPSIPSPRPPLAKGLEEKVKRFLSETIEKVEASRRAGTAEVTAKGVTKNLPSPKGKPSLRARMNARPSR